MNALLGYILGFVLSISRAYFVSRKLKTSIAKILPFCLMSSALVCYLFAMASQLRLGYILIILASIIPTTIHLFLNKSNLKSELKPFRTPSFVLICAIYILLGIVNLGRSFHAWDDFMHWGPFVKETYRTMSLYNSEGSMIEVHADYPPIISLYETFWVFLSGKYNESILFISLQFLQISFFLPFIDKIKWQKQKGYKLKFAGIAIAMVLAPAIIALGDDYFFATIMTDSLIGMLFAFGMANILLAKKVDLSLIIKLTVTFAFLILVKQIALAFIAICIASLIIKIICSRQNNKLKYITLAFATIVLALLLNFAWTNRVEKLGIQGQFQISSLVDGTKSLITSRGTSLLSWQKETIVNFAKTYLYDKSIVLGLSYFRLTIVFAIVAAIIAIKNKQNRKEIILQSALIILASIAYALLMMLLYVFCFGEYEGPILASYDRYLGTFWLAITMLGFSCLLKQYEAKELTKLPNLGIITVLVFILATSPASIALTLDRTHDKNNYADDTKLLLSNLDQNDKVYIVAQGTNGVHNVKLKYHLMPIETNPSFGSIFSFGPEDSTDNWTHYLEPKDFKANFEGYNYLYLFNIDQYFVEQYGNQFEETPISGGLYKISESGFELVGAR